MYVPTFNDGDCAILLDNHFIRVYDGYPSYDTDINYIDYDLLSHYTSRTGVQSFTMGDTLPSCSDITDNFYMRVDILDILLIFTLFVGWTWFLISKLIKTFFYGGKRL